MYCYGLWRRISVLYLSGLIYFLRALSTIAMFDEVHLTSNKILWLESIYIIGILNCDSCFANTKWTLKHNCNNNNNCKKKKKIPPESRIIRFKQAFFFFFIFVLFGFCFCFWYLVLRDRRQLFSVICKYFFRFGFIRRKSLSRYPQQNGQSTGCWIVPWYPWIC